MKASYSNSKLTKKLNLQVLQKKEVLLTKNTIGVPHLVYKKTSLPFFLNWLLKYNPKQG